MGFTKIEGERNQKGQENAPETAAGRAVVISAETIVTLENQQLNRRSLLGLAGLTFLLAACGSGDTPDENKPSTNPRELKKEATISLTAEGVVPDCLRSSESAVIEVRINIIGKGASVNKDIIPVSFTVLRGDANTVTIRISNNETITISQHSGWAASIAIPYNRKRLDGTTETGTAIMPAIPLLKYEGLNSDHQFCFEAPQTPVDGSLL